MAGQDPEHLPQAQPPDSEKPAGQDEGSVSLTTRAPIADYAPAVIAYGAPWLGSFILLKVVEAASSTKPDAVDVGLFVLLAAAGDAAVAFVRHGQESDSTKPPSANGDNL